ncbi:MAG: hypothetical protein UY58_C0004G0029 [Candidatus Magasanikbacteria bacterium GW2011_GWA2_50_22]|uniref:Uncharacterized protein n=1 Tax=Candidatus Magasanikbacteria bacterium GW2011_GWA2_50_22 TaxID=1619043 RepID=A0A0G1WFK5_9BACT|nr:MAG: hypothetical protein UY58_C0004G0029 [Candidatus Magasanikbacteria bacterium GW2011_GWA2_50_22]
MMESQMRSLFDERGRCIPHMISCSSGVGLRESRIVDPEPWLRLDQPRIDYAACFARIVNYFMSGVKYWFTRRLPILAEEFERRSRAILERLDADSRTANILKGVYLPFCLPVCKVADYGTFFEKTLLPAIDRAYQASNPKGRGVLRYQQAGLYAGQITTVHGSRHENFMDALSQRTVVGLYFPTVFRGFSVEADLEQLEHLPDEFLLAGAIETAVACVIYPQLWKCLSLFLDCAAVRWQDKERSGLSLKTISIQPDATRGAMIREAFLNCQDRHLSTHSGGLVVLG